MHTRILKFAILLALPSWFGCSTATTIRSGIWELSLSLQESMTREPLPFVKPKLVRVKVEPSDEEAREGDAAEGEYAEITPVPADEQPGAAEADGGQKLSSAIPPLYGDIRVRGRDHLPSIQIEGADRDWSFTLNGLVRSPEFVEGTRIGAKYRRFREPLLVEGVWTMRWLRDE